MSILKNLHDWKQFERLCADLLTEEGFRIESEPYTDHTGTDLLVIEDYHSHGSGQVLSLRWRVQCKHYAGSSTNLGRKEIDEIIYSFNAIRRADEGLFLIISSDYSETAKQVIDQYITNHPGTKVTLWNQRQLLARLERHPHLIRRYGLILEQPAFDNIFASLTHNAPGDVLVISDQSSFAHSTATALRHAGLQVAFLPFWYYWDAMRLRLVNESMLRKTFRAILCCLGDSFSLPLPPLIVNALVEQHAAGSSILFFPFVAWSRKRGMYEPLRPLCPVELMDPIGMSAERQRKILFGNYRRGGAQEFLQFDAFVENQYVELDPKDGRKPFVDGIKTRFGLAHSYEFLEVGPRSQAAWLDTTGNPFLVTNDSGPGRVAYLNSCCHCCLPPFVQPAPLEVSREYATVLRNVLEWLLTRR